MCVYSISPAGRPSKQALSPKEDEDEMAGRKDVQSRTQLNQNSNQLSEHFHRRASVDINIDSHLLVLLPQQIRVRLDPH